MSQSHALIWRPLEIMVDGMRPSATTYRIVPCLRLVASQTEILGQQTLDPVVKTIKGKQARKRCTNLMFPTPYVLITYVSVSFMVRRVSAASLVVALTANIRSTSGAEGTEIKTS